MANTVRKHEKDESKRLQDIVDKMNKLHSDMGGRDNRPERVALEKCMSILAKEISRGKKEFSSKGITESILEILRSNPAE